MIENAQNTQQQNKSSHPIPLQNVPNVSGLPPLYG